MQRCGCVEKADYDGATVRSWRARTGATWHLNILGTASAIGSGSAVLAVASPGGPAGPSQWQVVIVSLPLSRALRCSSDFKPPLTVILTALSGKLCRQLRGAIVRLVLVLADDRDRVAWARLIAVKATTDTASSLGWIDGLTRGR